MSLSMKLVACGLIAGLPAAAQLTFPGCADLKASDFQTTELFNRSGNPAPSARDPGLSEPTRMDVQVIQQGGAISQVNVYFVERLGNVKFYDGAQKMVSVMGKIPVWGVDDNGLMGLALAPDFAQSRLIYFWYSPKELAGQNRQLRLTRIPVKADNTLDMTKEKRLIEILASKTDQWHSGGPMQFDNHGDLWIAIGNNSRDLDNANCNVMSTSDSSQSAEWGSSSTANMRGGFIRIHPDNSEKGYSIPRGNFGEYWADRFEMQGNAALASEYRNPAKVLPEIYVKGERSNYSISVHPTKRWLAWGTVNWQSKHDEFNITKTPIFSGFPYFHGNNETTCLGKTFNVDAPANNSPFNSGVKTLPPAVPGILNNHVNVSIGGPIYAFDPQLNSQVKFPRHFDNTWILGTFNSGMWVAKLDTATLRLSGAPNKVDGTLLPGARNFIQGMYGADGALYLLNYSGNYGSAINPGLMRITYNGDCAPVSAGAPRAHDATAYQSVWLASGSVIVAEKGSHDFALHRMDGSLVRRIEGSGRAEYSLADLKSGLQVRKGLYVVRVRTSQGLFLRTVSLL